MVLLGLLLTNIGKAQESFILKGNVENLKKGQTIYLVQDGTAIDSTVLTEDKHFTFTGLMTEPTLVSLKLGMKTVEDGMGLYLDKGELLVESKAGLNEALIKGSKINTENRALEKMAATLEDTEPCLNFARTHPDSYISLVALQRVCGDPEILEEVKEIYNLFSERLKKTKKGAQLPTFFGNNNDVGVGTKAIAFSLKDVNGKVVKLSDFKGKYVLLDFWASWCAPCRAENPNLLDNFRRYKDKGLRILGISLDEADAKEAWLKAIKDDELPWQQVSDLKGWRNEAAQAYGVRAIPENFLIDPQGKIIAKGLRGEKLVEKLEEIFDKKKPENNGLNVVLILVVCLLPFLLVCGLLYMMFQFFKSKNQIAL
jgi:peroxiredoxin